jgi:hypothetical protein
METPDGERLLLLIGQKLFGDYNNNNSLTDKIAVSLM